MQMFYWRRKSRAFWSNLSVFIAIISILAVSAALGLYSRSTKAKRALQNNTDLGTHVRQLALLASELGAVDGSNPNAGQSMSIIRNQLGKELTATTDLAKKSKHLSPANHADLTKAINQLQTLETAFDDRFKVLQKPILYNPSLDFSVSVKVSVVELANRAQAAHDGLNTIIGTINFPISDNTTNNLQRSSDCFVELANLFRSNNPAASAKAQACTDNYNDTRAYLVTDLEATLNTQDTKNVLQTLSILSQKL